MNIYYRLSGDMTVSPVIFEIYVQADFSRQKRLIVGAFAKNIFIQFYLLPIHIIRLPWSTHKMLRQECKQTFCTNLLKKFRQTLFRVITFMNLPMNLLIIS